MSDKAGRNDPCPCGSGKKYKKCCWEKDQGIGFTAQKAEAAEQLTSAIQAVAGLGLPKDPEKKLQDIVDAVQKKQKEG